MDNWPALAIVLLTYQRTECALRTIRGICDNLDYSKRAWYVADDGSDSAHMEAILSELHSHNEELIGYHTHRFSPKTGIGWNKGLGACFQYSDYVLVMEDDWELSGGFDMNQDNHPGLFNIDPYICNGKFNPSPYIEMLSERDDVCMVRLGGAAVDSTVRIVGHAGHHYLHYLKQDAYAYSGNPHIRHARMMRSYGWYAEDERNPGELELDYDWRFRNTNGPDIWRVFDIPGWGIFHHIGEKRYR